VWAALKKELAEKLARTEKDFKTQDEVVEFVREVVHDFREARPSRQFVMAVREELVKFL